MSATDDANGEGHGERPDRSAAPQDPSIPQATDPTSPRPQGTEQEAQQAPQASGEHHVSRKRPTLTGMVIGGLLGVALLAILVVVLFQRPPLDAVGVRLLGVVAGLCCGLLAFLIVGGIRAIFTPDGSPLKVEAFGGMGLAVFVMGFWFASPPVASDRVVRAPLLTRSLLEDYIYLSRFHRIALAGEEPKDPTGLLWSRISIPRMARALTTLTFSPTAGRPPKRPQRPKDTKPDEDEKMKEELELWQAELENWKEEAKRKISTAVAPLANAVRSSNNDLLGKLRGIRLTELRDYAVAGRGVDAAIDAWQMEAISPEGEEAKKLMSIVAEGTDLDKQTRLDVVREVLGARPTPRIEIVLIYAALDFYLSQPMLDLTVDHLSGEVVSDERISRTIQGQMAYTVRSWCSAFARSTADAVMPAESASWANERK